MAPNSPIFRLRVDRVDDGDFVWVISEVNADWSDIELATSLLSYATPSQAMEEGAKVLEQLKGH